MSETKFLTAAGFYSLHSDGKVQLFQLQAEDNEGNLYAISFGAKTYLKDSIEKYIGKLFPIAAPKDEVKEVKEDTTEVDKVCALDSEHPQTAKSIFD
jgi:hypothetical protein